MSGESTSPKQNEGPQPGSLELLFAKSHAIIDGIVAETQLLANPDNLCVTGTSSSLESIMQHAVELTDRIVQNTWVTKLQ